MSSNCDITWLLKIINLLSSVILFILIWLHAETKIHIMAIITMSSISVNAFSSNFFFIKTCKKIFFVTIILYMILRINK